MINAIKRFSFASAALLSAAAPALAGTAVRPPVPSDPGEPNIFVLYAIAGLLVILCIAFAIMPSQRTHHD